MIGTRAVVGIWVVAALAIPAVFGVMKVMKKETPGQQGAGSGVRPADAAFPRTQSGPAV
jgi:hypothetical protein